VLEVMRQPLEDGNVTIARASLSVNFPSRFMLAAAMNPCPCGFFGDAKRECHCSPVQIQRHVSKISLPPKAKKSWRPPSNASAFPPAPTIAS
jgi:magnesium chelatase family protein